MHWRWLHRAWGNVQTPLLQIAGYDGTLSRGTSNRKLTKLYWPLQKRVPKRLVVLVEPKRGGSRFYIHSSANSAFHPSGVGKWVVIHVITWIIRVATMQRQTKVAHGCDDSVLEMIAASWQDAMRIHFHCHYSLSLCTNIEKLSKYSKRHSFHWWKCHKFWLQLCEKNS